MRRSALLKPKPELRQRLKLPDRLLLQRVLLSRPSSRLQRLESRLLRRLS